MFKYNNYSLQIVIANDTLFWHRFLRVTGWFYISRILKMFWEVFWILLSKKMPDVFFQYWYNPHVHNFLFRNSHITNVKHILNMVYANHLHIFKQYANFVILYYIYLFMVFVCSSHFRIFFKRPCILAPAAKCSILK